MGDRKKELLRRSGVVLEEDECLVEAFEAELWASSSNPAALFLGRIKRNFAMIFRFGYKKEKLLIITNKRVIESILVKICFFITRERHIKYVSPGSVKEIGYIRVLTCFCCCPAYYLYYQGLTQQTSILLKKADEASASKIANTFYNAVYRFR